MTKLPGFTHIWKESWATFKEKSTLMVTIGMIAVLPLVVINFFSKQLMDTSIILYFSASGLAAIWSAFCTLGVYASMAYPEVKTIPEVLRATGSRLIPFITTTLLQSAIVFIPLGLIVGAIVIATVTGPSTIDTPTPSVALMSFIGLIGFVVLVVWSFRFAFAEFIVFAEDKANIQALKASHAMTKGRVGDIWGKFVGAGLYAGAISIGFVIVQSIITAPISNDMAVTMVDSVFTLLQNAILTPIGVIFLAKLYHHVKSANNAQPTA